MKIHIKTSASLISEQEFADSSNEPAEKFSMHSVNSREFMRDTIWYHGTRSVFKMFDPKYAAVGVAQEGPGYYLTTDKDDARGYGPIILQYKITARRRLVSLTRPPDEHSVRLLIKKSPYFEDALTNWGENPRTALNSAVNIMMSIGSTKEVYTQVCYDFYRGYEKEWLEEMVRKGFAGVLIPRRDGVYHFVLYDISALRPVSS